MMKRLLYVCMYVCMYVCIKGQINLVPNYSFEDTIGGSCFAAMGVENPISVNHYLKKWCTYRNQSPDYYNFCANFFPGNPYPTASTIPKNCYGYQYPRTGDGYIGLGLYWLNYLPDSVQISSELAVIKLEQPLKQNHCYYGEFYFSLGDINTITVNRLGMLLSANTNTVAPFVYDNTVQTQIQWDTTQFFTDTTNWIKVSGKFMAQGNEQFLSIGNFRDGAHVKKKFIPTSFTTPCGITNPHAGCYVYIDDVSLYEIPQPNLGNDTTLCGEADSLIIGDVALNNNGTNIKWYKNNTPLATSSNTIIVSGVQTATYTMQYEGCTADTLVITYNAECPKEPYVYTEPIIPNVFTPNGDDVNDVWRFTLPKEISLTEFSIYNRWGNLISTNKELISSSPSGRLGGAWDGRTTAGEECSAGVYYYTLQFTDANGDEHKKNGYITLIR